MIGIALLGAGRMAAVHAEAIARTPAKIASIYDVDPDRAKVLAGQTGARATDSAEEAIACPGVDGVLVATASTSHVELTLKAVAAGKRVMCEKPLAHSYVEARRCVEELGAEAGRVFLAFNRRYDPGHRTLWERVRAGEIGAVEQLIITCRDPFLSPPEYVSHSGGVYRDMMVHDFDLARWILDEELESVFAHGSCLVESWVGEMGDVDTAMVMLRTASGKLGVITNGKRCSFGFDQRVEAFGSKGMLISDNLPRTALKQFGMGGTDARYEISDRLRAFFLERYGDSYCLEIEAFIRCIEQDRDAPVSARDGLAATYIAEAASRSYLTNQPVALNPRFEVDWTIDPPRPGKQI